MTKRALSLSDFTYEELFQPTGLARLDREFLTFLQQITPEIHEPLLRYRSGDKTLSALEISELLIAAATVLEQFLARLFKIEEAVSISQIQTISHNPIAQFKKYFVLRRAKKEQNKAHGFPEFAILNSWLEENLQKAALKSTDKELSVALLGTEFLANPDANKEAIETLVQWCTQALFTQEGQAFTKGWTSFHIPPRVDHANLIPTISVENDACGRTATPESEWRLRDGFKLTDPRMNAREVQDEVNYCIYCHDHDGDFCSKGFPVKKGDPAQGFKNNPLDLTMTGCPLEEKISEMHFLKKDGFTLAALAMVMVDNPMCPATGHRICNDCMKACIYQKQEPVNIPQIETRVLTDVLSLPWGVEIYDLLTRWNPLRNTQWVMKPYNGLKILIAGMGPAGFTLAHHLLLEGFAIVGFDGLKIEPLPADLINEPIYHFDDLKEALDERIMAGFGGVAEYGITVRWDKNFLKLIYLSLMRRKHFQVFGGVRFGGSITVEDAWEMGFDHFVLAVGAGLPKALAIPGSLAPGMRQANDFLMALQLGNAAKANSLTSLQIRLPAVVIGGGLTGVDTATELQAYYITQVEKILSRYEILSKEYSEEIILEKLDLASRDILKEFLAHGEAIRNERASAKNENRLPNFIKLLHAWGGVTIAYRRSIQESPAYINNHEELHKAFQEGIFYLEGLEPAAADLDEHGHVKTLVCHKRIRNEANEWVTTKEEVSLPARAILVATGTSPNTAYEFEHRGTFHRVNLQYQHYEDVDGELAIAHGVKHTKDPQFGPFTSYQHHNHRVSLIGDTHPVFHGNVVKAIASGMRTYPKILQILKDKLGNKGNDAEYKTFAKHMTDAFSATVVANDRQSNDVTELTIRAPLVAKHLKPGQFCRLQNFETHSPEIKNTLMQMEPLALPAAECNAEKGTIRFIIHEYATSSRLAARLKIHEPVSLMGPTGVRSKIPTEHETILIIGDQSSFAFLRSVGREATLAGNKVIFIGVVDNQNDVFCQTELEASTNQIIWLTKKGGLILPNRKTDMALSGDHYVTVIEQLASRLSLTDVDRIFIVGNTDMLRAFQQARRKLIKHVFVKDPKVVGSVYGNMQCMLKGVCAQCLQWQIDPETGLRTKAVFACSWQDQPLELVDIDHIDQRAMQNRLHDQLGRLWMDYVLDN